MILCSNLIYCFSKQKAWFEDDFNLQLTETLSLWSGYAYRTFNLLTAANESLKYVMVDAFEDIESSRSWVVSDERKAYFNEAKLHGVELKGVNDFGGAVNDASYTTETNLCELNTINIQDSSYQSPKPRLIDMHDGMLIL